MQSYPIWLNMHSHSCEATGTPRLINMQSREATVAQSQSRSDCYPIFLNMQSHSDCYAGPTRRSR